MARETRSAFQASLAAAVSASTPATAAKQAFGRVVRAADAGPVAVTRHGVVEAYVVSARWLEGGPRPLGAPRDESATRALVEARAAEAARDAARRERLARQLRSQDPALRRGALARLAQWQREGMLDAEVVREWREILALPAAKAVARACADAPRARLLRRSSPFLGPGA